ncbi:unnamed protein product [Chilo suppressalis]|uniref:Elongation of very long chain fatty acids protein n=1 Tax=Chilo suppressalis TaxID=168631 RepID=A0ABN8BIK5_CHISP|nr:hypothetical protein evm_007817 [Chilo suppressalis]CAH0407551.1 unnamed protein product [Chilo suppressalis]
MAAIVGKIWQGYQIVFDDWTDPRTKSWPLLARPYQGLIILGLYLMLILKWGPKWMKDRPPFNIDKLLIVYNAIQVLFCLYLFLKSISPWTRYKWICEPVDRNNSEEAVHIARLCYYYYLLKLIDLMDTVFFVLRKKFNQVSFLHVYHHTGMVMITWGNATYLPGGHGTLVGVINLFVHIVMYSYYLLTVAVPSVKKSIWLKKHITQLQILQFFWCVVHMGTIVFVPDCAYPRWVAAVFLPQNLFMLLLFIDFYIKTYIKKKPVSNKEPELNQFGNGLQKNYGKQNCNSKKSNSNKEHDS